MSGIEELEVSLFASSLELLDQVALGISYFYTGQMFIHVEGEKCSVWFQSGVTA